MQLNSHKGRTQSTCLEIINFALSVDGTKRLTQHLSLWKIRCFLQYCQIAGLRSPALVNK